MIDSTDTATVVLSTKDKGSMQLMVDAERMKSDNGNEIG
jgi:hypothetical protein